MILTPSFHLKRKMAHLVVFDWQLPGLVGLSYSERVDRLGRFILECRGLKSEQDLEGHG